jgi:hypothetical protein
MDSRVMALSMLKNSCPLCRVGEPCSDYRCQIVLLAMGLPAPYASDELRARFSGASIARTVALADVLDALRAVVPYAESRAEDIAEMETENGGTGAAADKACAAVDRARSILSDSETGA